ncbi:MAG TPA: RNA polymerase sigma factor [Terriglobales bacterium]|jgi:RNA polymerase sigma-70 factor (ECF subfamily)|nr:RNA polymerase sigma factor [Terriglobales bacterium]
MAQTIDVNLMALASGEHRVSELDDIETLMRLYKAKVLRFVAFSLGDRDAAESITHDCFLKAHATRAQFRGDCSVSTWLMRIAFNLVRDHTKSLKFRFWKTVAASAVDVHDLGHYVPSQASSPEAQVLAREKVQMIQRSLKELSPRQRSVFVMRFVEELDLAEIAEVTGMPVQTVKTHLYRAVAEIRHKFGAKA